MPSSAAVAGSAVASTIKDPRLTAVAQILEKKKVVMMDSDHRPVIGGSGGQAAATGGSAIIMDKLKQKVM